MLPPFGRFGNATNCNLATPKGEYPIGIDPERDRCDTSRRDAACGTVSFHDRVLRTIGSGRMPESGKWSLRRWLKNGFEPIGNACPALRMVPDV
ncbi:MAG: hypothetical protein OXC82_09845 [Rhodobacteraceae bacterium]|nr:hypothetical protein [Paracoccaceae bacterium]